MRLKPVVATWCFTIGVLTGATFEHWHGGGLSFTFGSLLGSIGLTTVWIIQRRRAT